MWRRQYYCCRSNTGAVHEEDSFLYSVIVFSSCPNFDEGVIKGCNRFRKRTKGRKKGGRFLPRSVNLSNKAALSTMSLRSCAVKNGAEDHWQFFVVLCNPCDDTSWAKPLFLQLMAAILFKCFRKIRPILINTLYIWRDAVIISTFPGGNLAFVLSYYSIMRIDEQTEAFLIIK
jgi:hypothetical protein